MEEHFKLNETTIGILHAQIEHLQEQINELKREKYEPEDDIFLFHSTHGWTLESFMARVAVLLDIYTSTPEHLLTELEQRIATANKLDTLVNDVSMISKHLPT